MKPILPNALLALLFAASSAKGEAVLQYFGTDWREITARMPELAEVGYNALWLPPPAKGSGGLSVGYDVWDRFDLGGKDQRGSVRTRYGTEADLQVMMATAHRFGLRVYFDNIVNHNAFDIPGFNATTSIDIYPGFIPEDFHLRRTEDGFYRKWDNTRDWNDTWQVQNLGLADLIDIAIESPNTNHGANEGDDIPKLSFVRQPNNPEYYLDLDLPFSVTNAGGTFSTFTFANKEAWQDIGVIGLANSANNGRFDWVDSNSNGQHDPGEASEPFTDSGLNGDNPEWRIASRGYGDGKYNMGNPISEDVNALLIRSGRWTLDRTRADGYRLDAVKHVPDYFFGQQSGSDKDRSGAGYMGQAQEQFNISRGFSDWNNHRDSVFDTEQGRDDAMMFGEHLGQPPGYGGYWDAGMRLVDNDLRSALNNRLGNPSNSLAGFDQPGAGGFAPGLGITHAQSHDSDYAARRELQHAYYLTRAGMPLIYTDGNNHAGILGASGGAFPRLANTNFLGQYNDGRIPNMLYVHNHFARGTQIGRWSDADFVAYERIDKRENVNMTDSDAATLLFMMNDNYSSGQARPLSTSFAPGAYLYNYSNYGGGFYKFANELNTAIVPAGGYFAFSWRSPETSTATTAPAVTILQGGQPTSTITYERQDGRDGDPGFNPYGLPDSNSTDYKYSMTVPRVTTGSNLRFIARADGSAENIMMALDGGVDINSQIPLGPITGDRRDHAPAISTDTFLGYEQMEFVRRSAEKFAAISTTRNVIGSPGAETYRCDIGATGFTNSNGSGLNSSTGTAAFIYHDPGATRDIGGAQFSPPPQSAANTPITVQVKTGYQFQINQVWLYYTTDGSAPEGSGGVGTGTTLTTAMAYTAAGLPDGSSITDWWTGTLPAMPGGTVLHYKIGGLNTVTPSAFPAGPSQVALKRKMETIFQINGFNATTAKFRPHNDYGDEQVGLSEGFHVLRSRAFLNRAGRASIYNTWTQTFYYDTQTPGGEIKFPSSNGETVGGQQYGAVVRTDPSVTEVWYHIDDNDATNNDSVTGVRTGNGGGSEPFTDSNNNGVRNGSEPFIDINGNGIYDAFLTEALAKVDEVSATGGINSQYGREWRFNYRNIPATGNATIKVRLLEVSSSRNMTLSASLGHATELIRTVNVAGPDIRSFVAFPQQDGQTIGAGYVMKVRFSAALADGLTEQQLRERFTVKIASSDSGSLSRAILQSPQNLPILYNVAPGFHDFQFELPNLYNGIPDFLHTIEVTLDRPSPDPDLVTNRQVRAQVTQPAVFVSINNPPEIDADGKKYEVILPAVPVPTPVQRSFLIEVETDVEATGVSVSFNGSAGTASLINDDVPNPRTEGNHRFWRFLWSNMVAGKFTFTANVQTDPDPEIEASSIRNATVVIRQVVDRNDADDDDDDDGLTDFAESTITNLPTTNSDTWTNGQVHVANAYGQTNPLRPDTDGDGLPDGLEVGWRVASNPPTNPATDTDGDGFPNSIGDLDPPFFNTLDNLGKVPAVNTASEGGDRAMQKAGSTTNPNNPDSDGDGIMDGIEDANRNGWVNGDGKPLQPGTSVFTTDRPQGITSLDWPNNKRDSGEVWVETSPTSADSDEDGLSDGFGEDKNFNGVIDGDANANRAYDPAEAWLETNPLNSDSDGDGLPDGWETSHGLDPLDNGSDKLSTSQSGDGLADNGAAGNPDGDTILVDGMTLPYTNALELSNNTDPRSPDTGIQPPPGSIVIGPQNPEQVGGVNNAKEFTDWSIKDLIALDEYDGDGPNNQGSDVYHAGDGFDTSRDIVALYARDGGDTSLGGDGNFYFRVDLRDLSAFAEDGKLDLYVVVDTGSPTIGEYALPDDVDVATAMKWEAVVACYSGNNGRVYVDTQNGNNSISIGQGLAPFGVITRDQNAADGFKKAYFNSDLDSVEFSISRKALRDAGWNGLNASQLNYQVFTTKDGTSNNPVGPGDIGGRNDIRDTIKDDFLASDFYGDQSFISQAQNAVLRGYTGKNADNDRGKRTKVISLLHGNQAIQPGNLTQALISTAGAGYYRPLDVHQAFSAPVALHVTPTLASSIQWAKVDPLSLLQNRDGPAFNGRIRQLTQGGIVDLLGSTFSDHIISYFPQSFNSKNVSLANEFLTNFYGGNLSTSVFWNPERVADAATLSQIQSLEYSYTFIDQMRHMQRWFGRNSALGDDGYRVNQVNGVKCFVINDQASTYRFQNTDNGVALPLRDLLQRKARSGTQDQVVILFSQWEDFSDKAKADAYDKNIRWIANRPWLQLVSPDQIASGAVDLSQPPDGVGDPWGSVDRGSTGVVKVAHDYIDYATQENYDNWYNGQSGREEGLRDKRFNIRPGVQLATGKQFGTLNQGTGIISEAWAEVSTLPAGNLAQLALGTAGAAVFQTGFHNQTGVNLSKYSTGAYIYPDTTYQTLAGFAKTTQAQFRNVAVFNRVQSWSVAAIAGSYDGTSSIESSDVDLDGEAENLIFNDRLFAVFEKQGGRMTGAWVRDLTTNVIHQAVGNPLGYAGSEDETEGGTNLTSAAVGAYRTSGFKDWFANGASNALAYVNDLYSAAPLTNGWTFTSGDGNVSKSITLSAGASSLSAAYTLGAGVGPLYIRFGLSPNLNDLLLSGQKNLSPLVNNVEFGEAGVTNYNSAGMVRNFVRYGGGNSANFNPAAVDRDSGVIFDTLNMRNQAQTQQVEIFGNSGMTFELGLSAGVQDVDRDGLPTDWETLNGLNDNNSAGNNGANGDPDLDDMTNMIEWLVGLNPQVVDNSAYPKLAIFKITGGIRLTFPTLPDRRYQVQSSTALGNWTDFGNGLSTTSSNAPGVFQVDDTVMMPKRFYRMVIRPVP